MRELMRRWWPFIKTALGLEIVALIGLRFTVDLLESSSWERSLSWGWLILSGALYLLGLFCSALTWRLLLKHFGQKPPLPAVIRSYFLAHLGKYIPGKALTLFLRADLLRPFGINLELSALTAFYEVLVTMSAGSLLAALLLLTMETNGDWFDGKTWSGLLHWRIAPKGEGPLLLSLIMLAFTLVPILPPVFNRIVGLISLPFRVKDAQPHLGWPPLPRGLALAGIGWLLMGGSLAALLRAVLGPEALFTSAVVIQLPAILAVSYVAGFLILVAPGGLGVREFLLTLFLTPLLTELGVPSDSSRATAVFAVIVLRLVWTAAELALAAIVWRLPFARMATLEVKNQYPLA